MHTDAQSNILAIITRPFSNYGVNMITYLFHSHNGPYSNQTQNIHIAKQSQSHASGIHVTYPPVTPVSFRIQQSRHSCNSDGGKKLSAPSAFFTPWVNWLVAPAMICCTFSLCAANFSSTLTICAVSRSVSCIVSVLREHNTRERDTCVRLCRS